MTQLLYADLTYAMRGALMDVHNTLGPGLPEQFYDEAASIAFQEAKIAHERQKVFDIFYRDILIGRHIPDATFLNDQVLLDYKVAPAITPLHKAQMISYLSHRRRFRVACQLWRS